jgi:hypothetical protein
VVDRDRVDTVPRLEDSPSFHGYPDRIHPCTNA